MDKDKVISYLQNEQGLDGKRAFDTSSPTNLMINIRRDDTVSPAKFKPDPLIPGGYLANGPTIEALNREIFTGGDSVDILLMEYTCYKCNNSMDLQFWLKCPYCGSAIDKNFGKKIENPFKRN
jgi:hypothetical protein